MYTLHYSFLTNVIRLFIWIECLINVYVLYVCATAVIAVTTTSITSTRFIELVEVYQWILNDLLLRKRIKQKYVCVLSLIFNGFSLFFQCIEMNVNEPMKMHTQSCWVTYQSITQLRPWISILPHSYNFNVVIQWLIWTSTWEMQLKKVLTWKPKEPINLYQRFEIKNKVSYKNMKLFNQVYRTVC